MTETKDNGFEIKRALISVSDKSGIVELAQFLQEQGVEIISTGGTKQVLKDAGVKVVPVSAFTGEPEIMDGRVKTLHPKIAAGILFRRDNEAHIAELNAHDYKSIDLVVVNLYPFEQTVASGAADEKIIENIDIGGPTLIRAAAKNFSGVAVLVSPAQYDGFVKEFTEAGGTLSLASRRAQATAAYARIADYDQAIGEYFNKPDEAEAADLPATLQISLSKKSGLRYGENPHQQAAVYRDSTCRTVSLVDAEQLAGKELSYNNYSDLDAALLMLMDFQEPFACVLKHANPCGAATAATPAQAYADALSSDPMSAFGSIIGLNREVDMEAAEELHGTQFVECIIAPGFAEDALAKLRKKKQRRLLALPQIAQGNIPEWEFKPIRGGFLYQSTDRHQVTEAELKIVTKVEPTPEQIKSLLFAFQLVKHVKSNAILIVQDTRMVGFGCGQTSRVDAVENAVKKAGDRAQGGVLASDAFFPMPDGVEAAAAAGVKAIIQPGGSKRDVDAIAAADEAGIAMVLTGVRHFRH
jgi:phosphoribosylaminoimidazolecarboxamide formyltransferase/IMP cyclohydrolase